MFNGAPVPDFCQIIFTGAGHGIAAEMIENEKLKKKKSAKILAPFSCRDCRARKVRFKKLELFNSSKPALCWLGLFWKIVEF